MSHPIEITVCGRIYHEASVADIGGVFDEPKALAPTAKGQVILTIHYTEGYDVESWSIFLRDKARTHRVPQSAKKLECQPAISGGVLKDKVKQINIVAKKIKIKANA